MQTIKLRSHVGTDGILKLEVPVGLTETDLEVTLVVQEVAALPAKNGKIVEKTPEELGWPAGFFEETEGSLEDDPIQRPPQGDYEVREPFV